MGEFDQRTAEWVVNTMMRSWELEPQRPDEVLKKTFRFSKTSKDGTRLSLYITAGDRGNVFFSRWPKDDKYERGRFQLRDVKKFELGDYEVQFYNGKERLRISDSSYSLIPENQPRDPRFFQEVYF